MNVFEVPISIFATFYNFVVTSWGFLTSPLPWLPEISEALDVIPDWVSIIIGTHNFEVILNRISDLTVLELVFGSSIILFLAWSVIKFFLPTS